MESYMESPLHGLTCGGLSLFRQIGLCAFSVEPLMTGLALDGFRIQVLLHLESDGIEDAPKRRVPEKSISEPWRADHRRACTPHEKRIAMRIAGISIRLAGLADKRLIDHSGQLGV